MRWFAVIGLLADRWGLAGYLSLGTFGAQKSPDVNTIPIVPLSNIPPEPTAESEPSLALTSPDAEPSDDTGAERAEAALEDPPEIRLDLYEAPSPAATEEDLDIDAADILPAPDLAAPSQTQQALTAGDRTRGLVNVPQDQLSGEGAVDPEMLELFDVPTGSIAAALPPPPEDTALLEEMVIEPSNLLGIADDPEPFASEEPPVIESVDVPLTMGAEAPTNTDGSEETTHEQLATMDASTAEEAEAAVPISQVIIATHLFAAPGQIPPEGFLAYGVVAFPQNPTPDTEVRFAMLCRAFRGNLAAAANVSASLPDAQQVVTIWPVSTPEIALKINESPLEEGCELAAKHYNLPHSEFFMNAARATGENIGSDRGPFLLAWNPGHSIGTIGAPVLSKNLSLVVTKQQAEADFRAWKRKIAATCWDCPIYRYELRRTLRLYSDYHGARIIGAIRAMVTDVLFGDGDSDNA